MISKNTRVVLGVLLLVAVIGYVLVFAPYRRDTRIEDVDSVPHNVTLSGTYVCLPHLDTTGPQTEECAFGLKTDDGMYYAVNFGASAAAMEQFQSNSRITAEGFIVVKEALSSDQWAKYNMRGIFTVTHVIDS